MHNYNDWKQIFCWNQLDSYTLEYCFLKNLNCIINLGTTWAATLLAVCQFWAKEVNKPLLILPIQNDFVLNKCWTSLYLTIAV